MKDLFVLTADADALASVRAALGRPRALGIRPITSEVDRHPGRDPGMVKEGPELVRFRVQKTAFQNVMLIWDHQGSGWDEKPPEKAQSEVLLRLEQVTWRGHSQAVVVVPEIEEWLWHDPSAIARQLAVRRQTLEQWIEEFANARSMDPSKCKADLPKELFEFAVYQKYRRKPLPRDFELIAQTASLKRWPLSQSFARLVTTLRMWFPA